MDDSKRGAIPMQVDCHLDKSQCAESKDDKARMQNVPYASAVGSIINSDAELQVKCYSDAGFETDRDDTKSQTGYVFTLNGGAVYGRAPSKVLLHNMPQKLSI
nr:hypothetical protein [Tanacetum cinerariifolium]